MSRKAQRRTPAKAGLWTAISTVTQSKAAKRHTKRRTGNASITSEHCAPRLPPSPGNTPYIQRNSNLLKIGFNCYKDYLASELWASIRTVVLSRDHRLCKMCNEPATEVHHACYSTNVLLGRRNEHLFSLCRKCHDAIETNSDGSKTTMQEANKRLGMMLYLSKKKRKKYRKSDRRKMFEIAEPTHEERRPGRLLSKKERKRMLAKASPRIPIIDNRRLIPANPRSLSTNPTAARWAAILANRKATAPG